MFKNKLLTWINLFVMAIYTIPVAYSIWFIGIFAKYAKVKYYIARSWCNPWMWAARAKLDFIKTTEYKTNQPYVVISNHLSNLDPMMEFKYLKIKWVFMAKKEVYKLPFFRTAAKAFNFIKPVPILPVETTTCPSSYCCADEPDSINIPAEDIEPLLIALFTKSLPEKFLSLEGASLEALTTFTYSVENPVSPTCYNPSNIHY